MPEINSMCAFPGCTKKRVAKGFCPAHWYQQRHGKTLRPLFQTQRPYGSPPRIICDEVPCNVPWLSGFCHVPRGDKLHKGYHRVHGEDGKKILVHRLCWIREIGPIEDGLMIDHQCRNRACCNTDHLRVVTRLVNTMENVVGSAWQLTKAQTHCKRGHPFDEANTYHPPRQPHTRQCRQCKRDESKRSRQNAVLGH